MSRSKTSRSQILDSTLEALEKGELRDLNMGTVAKLAGISRQAVYLHFDSRTELALELGRHADESCGLADELETLRGATDAADLLERLATFLGRFYPRIYPVIRMATRCALPCPNSTRLGGSTGRSAECRCS
jgi:AcrR family transcriptional regulator